MTSIREAYDNTIQESFTGMKLLLWAVPLFWCREMYLDNNIVGLSLFGSLFGILLIGFITESANNAIVKNPEIVPGMDFLLMAFNGIKTVIAMGVPLVVAYFLGNFILKFIPATTPTIKMTIEIFLWLFFATLPVCSYISYMRKLNILDAFNLKNISYAYGDTFIAFSYILIKLGLVGLIVVGFITYLFWLFIGLNNWIINFIWSITTMYGLVIFANCLAQLSDEIFTFRDKKEGRTSDN